MRNETQRWRVTCPRAQSKHKVDVLGRVTGWCGKCLCDILRIGTDAILQLWVFCRLHNVRFSWPYLTSSCPKPPPAPKCLLMKTTLQWGTSVSDRMIPISFRSEYLVQMFYTGGSGCLPLENKCWRLFLISLSFLPHLHWALSLMKYLTPFSKRFKERTYGRNGLPVKTLRPQD